MKWFFMIASFLLTRMSVKQKAGSFAWDMYEEVVYKSRQVMMLALLAFGASLTFCAGLLIALLNLTSQYDINGFVSFTSTLGMGLGLMAIAGISFAWVFAVAWPGVKNRKLAARKNRHEGAAHHANSNTQEQPHLGSHIENAVSVWIMDIVKEREARRAERSQHATAAAAAATRPAPSTEPRRTYAEASTTTPPLH